MAGKFVVSKTKNDGYKFNLKAANGEIIATSEVYSGLDACKNGVESVKKAALSPVEDQTVEGFAPVKNPKYEVYKDKADEFRFRLKASNGQIIVTGESYVSKAGCLNGIKSIGKNAPDADVIIEEN